MRRLCPTMVIPLALLSLFLLPFPAQAQLAPVPADTSRRTIAQKEQELAAVQLALAEARAQLARAEGKTDVAVAEWRKVLADREAKLREVLELAKRGKLCYPGPLDEAHGELAIARVWLADVEGRKETLAAELPRAIAWLERSRARYTALVNFRAIREEEARVQIDRIDVELTWARQRHAALLPKTEPSGVGKP